MSDVARTAPTVGPDPRRTEAAFRVVCNSCGVSVDVVDDPNPGQAVEAFYAVHRGQGHDAFIDFEFVRSDDPAGVRDPASTTTGMNDRPPILLLGPRREPGHRMGQVDHIASCARCSAIVVVRMRPAAGDRALCVDCVERLAPEPTQRTDAQLRALAGLPAWRQRVPRGRHELPTPR